MKVQRTDAISRLDTKKVLGDGSARFPARLTRTGILEYPQTDGSVIYELRPAEEVFSEDSLDSLRAVTVTEGHPATINGDNWRDYAVGHVSDNVKADGIYVAADLVIKDPDTLSKVDSKELQELSCGYSVDLDFTPGMYEGQKYDAIQRNIRYNHVGLGPSDWGRAGPQVRVLDGLPKLDDMSTQVQRTDAPANEPAKKDEAETLRKDLDDTRKDREAIRDERDGARAERDALRVKCDGLTAERDALKVKCDVFESEKKDSARKALVASARTVLGADYKVDEKATDKDIRLATILKLDPKFDAAGKSDAYLEVRFDMALAEGKQDANTAAGLNAGTNPNANAAPLTAGAEVYDASEAFAKKNEDAWKKPPTAGRTRAN